MATNSFIQRYSKAGEIRSVVLYTFSNFFNKGISFLFLLYFTQILSQSDFGMLSLFSNSILFIMPFVSLGILQSVNVDFFKLSTEKFRDFFTTSFIMPACVTIIAVLLLIIFKNWLESRYHFPPLFTIFIPLTAILLFVYELMIILMRNNQQPVQYLWVSIGRLVLEMSIAFCLISAFGFGWHGRILGVFLSYLFFAIYGLYYFKQNGYLFGKVKKQYLNSEALYSIPIITMQASVFCLSYSAVYYITFFTNNLQMVGVFSVAATFASLVSVFSMALVQYVHPKLYSLLAQKNTNHPAIKKLFVFYLFAMAAFTLIIICLLPVVYHNLLKRDYLPGLQFCYLICIGCFFWSVNNFFYAFLLYSKQRTRILLVSVTSILISVLSHSYFIKNWGAYGAAVSMCVSYFIVLIVTVLFVWKQVVPVFIKTKPVSIL